MITWKEDPLITDDKFKYVSSQDEEGTFVNIYRALVSPKTNFKNKKSFAQRTPYLKGENTFNYVKSAFINKFGDFDKGILMAMRSLQNYTKLTFSSLYKAKYRYKKILESGKLNLVFARVLSLILTENNEESIKVFNSLIKNSKIICRFEERVKVRLPHTLTNLLDDKIVYLAGVIAGDGNLDSGRNTITISDGHPDSKKLLFSKMYFTKLSRIFSSKFGLKARLNFYQSYWQLRIHSKWLLRFFNHFFDLPFGNKSSIIKKPQLLHYYPEKEGLFWRGLFDTDASIRKNLLGIVFVTKSRNLKNDLIDFCSRKEIDLIERFNRTGAYELYVSSKDYVKFARYIGLSHPRKQGYLLSHLKRGPTYDVFYGINEEVKIQGYYDLIKVRGLMVTDAGDLIHKIRTKSGHSLKEIANITKIKYKTVWRYEKGKLSVPLSYIVFLGEVTGYSKIKIYRLLMNAGARFSVHRSTLTIKLPLIPKKDTLKLLSYLRPYTSEVYIKINNELPKIEELFDTKVTIVKRNRKNDHTYICSKALSQFLKVFHQYKLPWNPLKDVEINNLKEKLTI